MERIYINSYIRKTQDYKIDETPTYTAHIITSRRRGHWHSHRAAVGSTGGSPPMGFLRKIGSFFGISRDDADHPESPSSAAAAAELPHDRAAAAAAAHGARRGFSVQVPVPVERQGPGPVLVPCPQGDGGVQVHPREIPFPSAMMASVVLVLRSQRDLVSWKGHLSCSSFYGACGVLLR